MASVYVLATLLSWGIGGLFDKKALEKSTGWSTYVACQLFNIPLAIVLFLVLPLIEGSPQLNSGVLWWQGLNAFFSTLATFAYYQAMNRAGASWVLGITAGYPIVGQLLSVVWLGEPFSYAAIAAAIVVSLGIAAIAHSGAQENKALSRKDKWVLVSCVVACLVFWGVFGIFDKLSQSYVLPLNGFLVSSAIRGALCIFIVPLLLRKVRASDMSSPRMWAWTWSSSSCLAIGNMGFVMALPLVPTGYLIIVTACYPMVMYIGAVCFLSEKLNYLRFTGIALVIAGLAVAELAK